MLLQPKRQLLLILAISIISGAITASPLDIHTKKAVSYSFNLYANFKKAAHKIIQSTINEFYKKKIEAFFRDKLK